MEAYKKALTAWEDKHGKIERKRKNKSTDKE